MQLVTIGSKYQIVIPKEVRKILKGIKPGNTVALGAIDENTATIKIQPQNWVERTRGIMSKAWKGVDPAAEINQMRDEWEEKVKDTENELKKV